MKNDNILIILIDEKSISEKIIIKSLNQLHKIKKKITIIGDKNIFSNLFNKISKSSNKKKIIFYNFEKKNNNYKYTDLITNLAIKFLKNKKACALINMPIDKKKCLPSNFNGYTEFFSFKTNTLGEEVMLLYNEFLAVSPLTTHYPLKKVHNHISEKKIINSINSIQKFYKKFIKKKINILVTGYNPHCGVDFKNRKEDKLIYKTISKIKKKFSNIKGPYPADTIFTKIKKNNVVLGMYHDQVLAPFKTLIKYNAANITINAKYLRLSPDHGTGKNLKKFNEINTDSFLYCVYFCDRYL